MNVNLRFEISGMNGFEFICKYTPVDTIKNTFEKHTYYDDNDIIKCSKIIGHKPFLDKLLIEYYYKKVAHLNSH